MPLGPRDEEPGIGAPGLTAEEIEVLKRACEKYRHSLPVYLKASEPQLRLLESILRKLTGDR